MRLLSRVLSAVNKVIFLILFNIANSIDLRYCCSATISIYPERLRNRALKELGMQIGDDSWIRSSFYAVNFSNIIIGRHSKVGPFSQIWSYGLVVIGDCTEIGSSLIIHTSEHLYNDVNAPIVKQGSSIQAVTVGNNVYIGSRVTILPGVTINDNTIVAAGAVVTRNLPSGYIYAGVPAKPIKSLPSRNEA